MNAASRFPASFVAPLFAALLLAVAGRSLEAQVRDTGQAAEADTPAPEERRPGARQSLANELATMRVYLLTMGPGDAVWERFGHNAILLRDTTRGLDVAYNYGMFSFDQPGFVGRLLQGRMLYWMQPMNGARMLLEYRLRNRSVRAQELALTPAQKYDLARFLEWNARPENAEYLYDPFRDNCSTRVRDALDRVLGGELHDQLRAAMTDRTYRSHSLRLLEGAPAAHSGLLLVLGQPMDEPLSRWQEAFIPMELRDAVASAYVTHPDGSSTPLVVSEETWFQAERAAEPEVASSRMFAFLLLGLLIAAAFLGLGHAADRSRAARVALALFAFLWAINIGVLGTIIGALWAFTDHSPTYRNENLFTVNSLSIVLALLVLPAFLARRALRAAFLVGAAVAALALLGFVLQLLPALDQQNGEVLAATLPAHLALAAVLYLWTRQQRPVPANQPPARPRTRAPRMPA